MFSKFGKREEARIFYNTQTINTLKVLLSSAVAAALVFGFAGCADNEDEHNILYVKGDTAYIGDSGNDSVGYTNDSDVTYRGFRTLKTKHTDAVAIFYLKGAETEDPSDRTGVLGYVFDLNKDKRVKNNAGESKTVYDFTAVSLRKNGNNIQAYISRFEGVDPSNMDGGNNFKDVNGDELNSTGKVIGEHNAKETEYLKGASGAYANLTGVSKDSDGYYKVAVEVTAAASGVYSVKFYDGNDATAEGKDETNDAGDTVKTGQIKAGAKLLTIAGNTTSNPVTIDASWKADGLSKPKQTDMGFYAAVYPKKTLEGKIQLPYILNEDEVIEWED